MSKNPQKILKDRYHVVPRSIIFLIKEGKVLLQKGSPDKKIYPGLYNGIGGHIERGEDILSGAKRELEEETGLSCSDLVLAGTISIDVNETEGILLFVFTGSDFTGELTHSEEGTLQWIEISQLETLSMVEDVPELIEHVMRFVEKGQLFMGKYLYTEEGERAATWQWS